MLRSLVVVLRREGAGRTLRRGVNRLFRVHRFRLFGIDLREDVAVPPLPPGAVFRELPLDELRRLRAGRQDLPADFYRDEIDPDERCFAILYEGALAYVNWVSSKGGSGFFRLGPREVEGTRVFCLPEYRSRSFHRCAQGLLVPLLRAEGKRRLYYAVHASNYKGITPLLHAGFREVGTGYRLGVLTWKTRRAA